MAAPCPAAAGEPGSAAAVPFSDPYNGAASAALAFGGAARSPWWTRLRPDGRDYWRGAVCSVPWRRRV